MRDQLSNEIKKISKAKIALDSMTEDEAKEILEQATTEAVEAVTESAPEAAPEEIAEAAAEILPEAVAEKTSQFMQDKTASPPMDPILRNAMRIAMRDLNLTLPLSKRLSEFVSRHRLPIGIAGGLAAGGAGTALALRHRAKRKQAADLALDSMTEDEAKEILEQATTEAVEAVTESAPEAAPEEIAEAAAEILPEAVAEKTSQLARRKAVKAVKKPGRWAIKSKLGPAVKRLSGFVSRHRLPIGIAGGLAAAGTGTALALRHRAKNRREADRIAKQAAAADPPLAVQTEIVKLARNILASSGYDPNTGAPIVSKVALARTPEEAKYAAALELLEGLNWKVSWDPAYLARAAQEVK